MICLWGWGDVVVEINIFVVCEMYEYGYLLIKRIFMGKDDWGIDGMFLVCFSLLKW